MGNSSTEQFAMPALAGVAEVFSWTATTSGALFFFSPASSLFPLLLPLSPAGLLFQSGDSNHFRRIDVPSLPAFFACGGCFAWGSRRASRFGVWETLGLPLLSISCPPSRSGIAVVPLAMGRTSTLPSAVGISLGLLSSSFGRL